MKRTNLFAVGSLLLLSFCAVLAQSIVGDGHVRWSRYQTYNTKDVPPISLNDAYARALTKLGDATNRFHCISANCTEMGNSNGWTGWTFHFCNTNGQEAALWVFFDGGVTADVRSAELFYK